ncbi:protein MMS22-like isoform X2 [Portunus trituberculatus]|nr:protein MMS22-like isoform X2 [Portunus trituberculatus]
MQEVMQTLVFVGPLHQVPHHVITAASTQGNKCPSASYHLLHLHLDVRWWSLVILHMAELSLGPLVPSLPLLLQEPPRPHQTAGDSGKESQSSPTQQCISMVMWDLVTLMSCGGSSFKKGVSELHQEAGFSCGCGLELAVMMLHFLEYRHACLAQQTFWEEVQDKLLVLLKTMSESSSSSTITPPGPSTLLYPPPLISLLQLPHVWWLLLTFTKLHTYDNEGKKVANRVEVKSEVKLLRTLLRLSLGDPRSGNQPTEAELRFFTRCCMGMLEVWGGSRSSEWAAPLWDHMAKHLDSPFLLPGAGLEGLACISKTIGGWLEQVRSRVCDPAAVGKTETSWQIFLRIVVGVVKSGPLEWRQMRGRIFSKFHGRKMSELTPTGLYNTVSLFLTLASSATDTLDVVNKLGELLSLVPTCSTSKSRMVWRGFLAGALLLVDKGCEVSPLAERLSPIVTAVCHHLTSSRDPQQRRELGQLLISYAEALQEVFEHSHNLSLAQHSLICGAVGGVLPHATAAEVKAIAGAMDAALAKVMTLSAQPENVTSGMVGPAVIEVVWKEFGPSLKSLATSSTPPQAVASLSASLTLCLVGVLGHKEAASGLFHYFLTHEGVSTGCSLHYASCLLSHPDSLALLASLSPGHERMLVSCWLCGLIGVGDENEAVDMLTPQILRLPSMVGVLPPTHPTDPFAVAICFIKGVAAKFSSIEVFADRIAYREDVLQCFSGLDKAFGGLLRKSPPASHLPQALTLIANLFFHAHSVIYVKSKPTCPMATLLNTVLLPTPIYSPEKPLSAAFTASISSVLPRMVCGIGCLGLTQDAYLLRCVRDIFTHYLHRFPVKTIRNYTTTFHPFLATLHGEVRLPVLEELRKVFLEVVRDSYLARRNTSPVHLQVALSLLTELLQRNTMDWLEILCCSLLVPLLELLLTLEEQTTKRLATDLLQKLLQEAEDRGIPSRRVLVDQLRELVGRHMSWSSGRLFRVLRVIAVLHRPLLLEALPHVTQAVTRTEEKRGTGLDHTLRQGYQALLSSLGMTAPGEIVQQE